jgi:hypothetical protein
MLMSDWVTSCRDDYIDLMPGALQKAAGLLQHASRQVREHSRGVTDVVALEGDAHFGIP